MKKQVLEGRQCYVICPMIEENENLEAENVIDYAKTLQEEMGDNIQVAYLHGKMKQTEKDEIMEAFGKNEIQILVSTTVIEVGIDVPNATVMLIENAERFGLAQLHQLRGRVGRGTAQSYCILISDARNDAAVRRLDEAVGVDAGVGGQRADEADVRAFRRLDGAHAAVMAVMDVADLHAGTLAGEAAGAQAERRRLWVSSARGLV